MTAWWTAANPTAIARTACSTSSTSRKRRSSCRSATIRRVVDMLLVAVIPGDLPHKEDGKLVI